MATSKGILGDTYTVKDSAIAISIDRYNELIRKETFYDELIKQYDLLVLLNERLKLKLEEEN